MNRFRFPKFRRPILLLRRWIPLIVASFLFTIPVPQPMSTAYAQSSSRKKSSKKKRRPSRKQRRKTNSSLESTSESRSGTDSEGGKSSKFLLGQAGLAPQPLIGVGGTFGWLKANGTIIETGATMASGKKGFIAARIIHLGARYRFPIFKIGYYAGGLGFRMASGAWNVLSISGSEYPTTSSLNAVTLDGAIGAQTNFGSIIVAADVLGVSFPVFKLGVKKSALQEEDVDLEDEKSQQASFDAMTAGLNLTIAKVGIGINF